MLDATIIDLCLSLFPWAKFHHGKGAIKLHTLMDLRGNIPCVLWVPTRESWIRRSSTGSFPSREQSTSSTAATWTSAVCAGWSKARPTSSSAPRGICDSSGSTIAAVDKSTGLRSDQTIRLADPNTSLRYPESLRRIHYFDSETGNRIVVLTDHFTLPALTVARLYKCRWQVELFFKWIKQHLKIKAFYGTSLNAVQTQIWIAISIYLLMAIAKKELRIERSLSEIQQILEVAIFQKEPILQVLSQRPIPNSETTSRKQPSLFDI